jgi:hypothetical protein
MASKTVATAPPSKLLGSSGAGVGMGRAGLLKTRERPAELEQLGFSG